MQNRATELGGVPYRRHAGSQVGWGFVLEDENNRQKSKYSNFDTILRWGMRGMNWVRPPHVTTKKEIDVRPGVNNTACHGGRKTRRLQTKKGGCAVKTCGIIGTPWKRDLWKDIRKRL